MKNRVIMTWCIAIGLCLGSGSTFGQDFGQLLAAVEKIENNLKDLINQEAVLRARQVSELKLSIAKKSPKSAEGMASAGVSEEQLADLITELTDLRAQVAQLEKYFDGNSIQFASLDDMDSPVADRRVEAIDARLEALTHEVQGLAHGQHAPGKMGKSNDQHAKTSVNGKLYGHVLANISDNEGNFSEFALSRAYLTVRSKVSDHSDIRVTTDLRTIDEKYNIILKYAYFDWRPAFGGGIMGLRFGLQPTEYIDYMNKLWGRRYAAPTIGDLHHFLTSSDLGMSTIIGFGPESKLGFVKLALLNGTSYTHVQELNSRKDFNIVTLLTPFKGSDNFKNTSLLMQFYTGTQNMELSDLVTTDTSVIPWDTTVTGVSSADWKRQMFSIGGAFVWDHTVDLGFDLNFVTLGKGALNSSVKKQGLSFFGAFYMHNFTQNAIVKNLGIIGRIDLYDPETGSANNSETLAVIGIESKPMYSLKVALNYRINSFQDAAKDRKSMLFVNTLFKF